MKATTENTIRQAYSKAMSKLYHDDTMLASAASAGFVIPEGQKRGEREGFQVFVKICRFSEKLLKSKPLTGGLLDS